MPNVPSTSKDGRIVQVFGNSLHKVSTVVSVPATTDYADNDVLSDSASAGTAWTFSDVVQHEGGTGTIVGAIVICETTDLTQGTMLFLFKATPTSNLNDNAANTAVLWADRENYIGRLTFAALSDIGGVSEAQLVSGAGGLPLPFLCAENDNDIYGILATTDAITGEIAGHDYMIILLIKRD